MHPKSCPTFGVHIKNGSRCCMFKIMRTLLRSCPINQLFWHDMFDRRIPVRQYASVVFLSICAYVIQTQIGLFMIDRIDYYLRKIGYRILTIIIQPCYRYIKQHSCVYIWIVFFFIRIVLLKSRYIILIEIIKIYILKRALRISLKGSIFSLNIVSTLFTTLI